MILKDMFMEKYEDCDDLEYMTLLAQNDIVEALINWYWKWEGIKNTMSDEDRRNFDENMYGESGFISPLALMVTVLTIAHEVGEDPDAILNKLGNGGISDVADLLNESINKLLGDSNDILS